MGLIRPELVHAVSRYREVILGGGVVALGLWVAAQGGYLLVPAGVALVGLGAGWAVLALRRLRFARAPDGPGLVDLDEGQVGYLGPGTGGYVSLADLVELRLLRLRGRQVWRLKQADGQALLIPVDAAGAEALFDAFASLPGMDTAALVAGLQATPPTGATGAGATGAGATGVGATGAGATGVGLAAESLLVWARSGRGITRG